MAWYKTKVNHFCLCPYIEEFFDLVYEEPDEYEWGEDEPEPCWEAFYVSPIWNRYPMWSSWLMGRESALISEDEAKELLAQQNDGTFWKKEKVSLFEKLNEVKKHSQEVLLQEEQKKQAFILLKEEIYTLSYEQEIVFIKHSFINTIQQEIATVHKKQEEAKRQEKAADDLLEKFFGFQASEEEEALIDHYWILVAEGNYERPLQERKMMEEKLKKEHKIMLVTINRDGKKIEQWIRIQ